jgi:hypothetical protein
MKVRQLLSGTLLALMVTSLAQAVEVTQGPCFWGRRTDPDVVNVFYPDEGAIYWSGRPVALPGTELVFHGEYPHSRYFSFNVYNEQLQPVDALTDVEIVPDDAQAPNPFAAGAPRDDSRRSYTVHVKPGPRPAAPELNTLYLSIAGLPSPASFMLYRIYVSDDGRDVTGDVGLPRVELRLPDGSRIDQTASCTRAQETAALGEELGGLPVQQTFADQALPGIVPLFATDPVSWEKFFNLQHSQAALVTRGTPLRPLVDDLLAKSGGGFLSNRDNDYAVGLGDRAHGPVLVLHGRAPTTPRTRDGRTTMEGGQLRYWSLCTNDRPTTRFIDCLLDEDALLDHDGFYTVVVSAPADRPANANEGCGVRWLAWGINPETMVILRHMLPDPGFASALQRVAKPADLTAVLGDYLPTGMHMTQAEFEALGCPASL